MTFKYARGLFHGVLGTRRRLRSLLRSDGIPAPRRPNTGTPTAMGPVPMRPGSAFSDWLTQTVAYHH